MAQNEKPRTNKIDPKIGNKPESSPEDKDECESVLDGPACIDGVDEREKDDRRKTERRNARFSRTE